MENPKFTKFLAFCQNDGLFSAFYALQKQTLSINVWKLREFWIFNFETIILNLEKVFSNLEPEGQGGGIIMGVTRLLLLGPFYYIQTNFSILFCTRLQVLEIIGLYQLVINANYSLFFIALICSSFSHCEVAALLSYWSERNYTPPHLPLLEEVTRLRLNFYIQGSKLSDVVCYFL